MTLARAAFLLAGSFALVALASMPGGAREAHGAARPASHKPAPGKPAPAVHAPPPPTLAEAATRIRDRALASDGAWTRLAWLTDRIGPRLSGSPGAAAAVAWTLDEFRRDGMANVHSETVMVPHWVRGEESISIVDPVARPVVATAIGMSVPTPADGITAEVIETDSLEALTALGDRVKGKIVLFNKLTPARSDGSGYHDSSPLRTRGPSEAARLGAVGALVRSLGTLRARLPHTGSLRYLDDAPQIPAAAIAEEDAERIHRLLAAGSVRVRMILGCTLLPDVESANVVADLPGRERPDEIVVVSGHLDSWDLGDGAIDDGAGVAVSMETLRLLKGLGLEPRRTIRAVLYMNEENGVRGGKAYVEAHKADLERHVAAIESDSGAGPPLGFRVFAGPGGADTVGALVAHLAAAGSHATEVATADSTGVDIDPLRAAGVPLLGLRQDATRYFDWHHTAADTLDKIEPSELAENVAALAFMAYALADEAAPLPRIPEAARTKAP
jgi:carboxypeptidase Q